MSVGPRQSRWPNWGRWKSTPRKTIRSGYPPRRAWSRYWPAWGWSSPVKKQPEPHSLRLRTPREGARQHGVSDGPPRVAADRTSCLLFPHQFPRERNMRSVIKLALATGVGVAIGAGGFAALAQKDPKVGVTVNDPIGPPPDPS